MPASSAAVPRAAAIDLISQIYCFAGGWPTIRRPWWWRPIAGPAHPHQFFLTLIPKAKLYAVGIKRSCIQAMQNIGVQVQSSKLTDDELWRAATGDTGAISAIVNQQIAFDAAICSSESLRQAWRTLKPQDNSQRDCNIIDIATARGGIGTSCERSPRTLPTIAAL